MLRGRKEEGPASMVKPVAVETAGFPGVDQPYGTDERPAGILFYGGRESFFRPYQLLQAMHCQPEKVTLTFANEDVIITGRGLHELYVQLAAQRVWRIVKQGERYAGVTDAALFIANIERIARIVEEPARENGRK